MASDKLPPGTGAKVVRFVCWYFAVEFVPFAFVHWVYHKPVATLVVPYLLFGLPALMQLAVWGLWILDARGASVRILGWCWFWLMMAVVSAAAIGTGLGGMATHSVSRSDVVWGFVFFMAINAPIIFFTSYLKVVTNITTRRLANGPAAQPDGSR